MMGSIQREFNVSNEVPMTERIDADDATQRTDDIPRILSDAAKRALAEAEVRRQEALRMEAAAPKEIGGRGGNDPARYGDWEVKGMASDF